MHCFTFESPIQVFTSLVPKPNRDDQTAMESARVESHSTPKYVPMQLLIHD